MQIRAIAIGQASYSIQVAEPVKHDLKEAQSLLREILPALQKAMIGKCWNTNIDTKLTSNLAKS